MHQFSAGDMWGPFEKSFDRLRNLSAILKWVVFVTTSPDLPYTTRHGQALERDKLPLLYTAIYGQALERNKLSILYVTRYGHTPERYKLPILYIARYGQALERAWQVAQTVHS